MTYLRNAWTVAAWATELPAGELLARTLLDEPLVFYRDASGTPRALADRCPHRFAPLSMGGSAMAARPCSAPTTACVSMAAAPACTTRTATGASPRRRR